MGRDSHAVKWPSEIASFSQWIELNRHRKLITLEQPKPPKQLLWSSGWTQKWVQAQSLQASLQPSCSSILHPWFCQILRPALQDSVKLVKALSQSRLLNSRSFTLHKILVSALFLTSPFRYVNKTYSPCHWCSQPHKSAILAQRHLRYVWGPHGHQSVITAPGVSAISSSSSHWLICQGSSSLPGHQAENEQEKGWTPWHPVLSFPKLPLICGTAFAHRRPKSQFKYCSALNSLTSEFPVMPPTDTGSLQLSKAVNQSRLSVFGKGQLGCEVI